jgi:hypothetical protein
MSTPELCNHIHLSADVTLGLWILGNKVRE